jgi:hypothetical protein
VEQFCTSGQIKDLNLKIEKSYLEIYISVILKKLKYTNVANKEKKCN